MDCKFSDPPAFSPTGHLADGLPADAHLDVPSTFIRN
jgi:hypothetical protein